MDIESAKKLSYENMRKLYKAHLQGKGLGKNTVSTVAGDTFYLWKNVGQDEFWRVVTSDDFENVGRESLFKALSANSSGNVSALVTGYLSTLRRFRDYVYSEESYVEEQDGAKALKEFLLDIECLDPLAEWTSKFNMFDILKITRTEIRHSNMLSWLLNPNENHGLGDSVIRGFVQYVVSNFADDKDVFTTLLMNFYDFSLQREWCNIDILAISTEAKFVFCIENKVDSKEHDNQLDRYRKIIEDVYPDYRKMYVYLSPEGVEASDSDYWCSMSYQDVLTIIENAKKKVKLLPDVELLISNYIDAIRRDIVGDERLVEICAEIYEKHKKALDLIFENRPDRALQMANIFKAWATEKTESGEIEVVPEKCSKSYTRFKTKIMSDILPDSEEANSGWNTKNHYFYEIRNIDGVGFLLSLTLSSRNLSDEKRSICDKIYEHSLSKQQKANWQWSTVFSTKQVKIDEGMSEDKIFEQLDKKLVELKAFEEKLKLAMTQ